MSFLLGASLFLGANCSNFRGVNRLIHGYVFLVPLCRKTSRHFWGNLPFLGWWTFSVKLDHIQRLKKNRNHWNLVCFHNPPQPIHQSYHILSTSRLLVYNKNIVDSFDSCNQVLRVVINSMCFINTFWPLDGWWNLVLLLTPSMERISILGTAEWLQPANHQRTWKRRTWRT